MAETAVLAAADPMFSDIVFLLVIVSDALSSEAVGYAGYGVTGLGAPDATSSPSPSSVTEMLLSVRSMSTSVSCG